MIESGINYVEVANEAAFYGPKIDVQVWSAIGRESTIAPNQVDIAVPARFGFTHRVMEAGALSVRLHHGGQQGAKPKAEVGADIQERWA